MHDVPDLDTARALWDALPHGVLVIDDRGTVRMFNERAMQMTGWGRNDEVVGRSVLDFIETDDVAFVAAGLERRDDFSGVVLGPFRIRYRTRNGEVRWTECWAHEAPPDLGFRAHLVTLQAESVADGLAVATRQIAAGDPLETALSTTAAALGAFPVVATTSILSLDGTRIVSTSGDWPLDLPPSEGSADSPWERCIVDGLPVDTVVDELPVVWRTEASRHGLGMVWVRSIDADGRRGVMVLWRRAVLPPTPNQQRSIDAAVDIARLAWSQHDHRRQLVRAAETDPLTGAFNRAKLDAAIRSGVAPAGAVYIDLDDFKSVNDRHGHHIGDLVLQSVTSRLRHIMDEHDQLYRVGGDEFVILTNRHPSATGRSTVTLATAILATVDRPIEVAGCRIRVTATVGAADNPDARPIEPLLREADQHLLTAKHAGKHRWHTAAQQTA